MRIAFTHNLKVKNTEEDAEFDTPETVGAIQQALSRLGHQVDLVEVSGPPSRTVALLEALNPDLVFNTAEGRHGRYREAFFPGIFESLGIPFTGSDAYVCTVTLDKRLTKTALAEHGVRTPKWRFVHAIDDLKAIDLRFPLILKPNYEGSSKGITTDSVVETKAALHERAMGLLDKYPAGVLVEEYIEGRDITVPFIEGASPATEGILKPLEYRFSAEATRGRKYVIYDYDLKNKHSDWVDVAIAQGLPDEAQLAIREYSLSLYRALGMRDFGRADFRVTPKGEVYFIEVNALPSLEPGAGLYLAAAEAGLKSMEEVLDCIVKNAARRYGLGPDRKAARAKTRPLRVGFTYNLKRIKPSEDPATDVEAEYDSESTLNAIREAIASYGHDVINLEAVPELPAILPDANVDVVFNVAEGIKGRNREAQIPAILELLDIPYTGSDPATLSLTLDKALAKRIVREAGVRTPRFLLLHTGKEKLPPDIKFPLILKPVAEGSSRGVLKTSVVESDEELRRLARVVIERYRQPVLVEEYLSGREFTVALLGEKRPKVLPPMEIVFMQGNERFPIYGYQHKLHENPEIRYDAPARIDEKLRKEIEQTAKKAFMALGCRDVARIDFRLDSEGHVHFVECNPLPGLTPGWSDLCLIAESAGIDYRSLIGEILAPAIRRHKEKRKILMMASKTPGVSMTEAEASPAPVPSPGTGSGEVRT